MIDEQNLFGVRIPNDLAARHRLINSLTKNWSALMGRPPGDLTGDLEAMAGVFGSGVSPKSIKARVYELPHADEQSLELEGTILMIVDGSALITPEGRILLDVLLDAQVALLGLDIERQLGAVNAAVAARSEWHARWLRKQFESTISAPVLGAALFLLINGSIGADRALLLSSDAQVDRELGETVLPLIAGFSELLGGREPDTYGGIRGHWAFSQVSRLLGRDVAREKGERGAKIFVRTGRDKHLLDQIAKRLDKLDPAGPRLHVAVTSFIDAYRRNRGVLASMGQMHEDPTATRRIAERLIGPGATS
ncbi:hypothetical protein [Aeromicrobium sp. Leaf245]|uniref:hypothetical protein n=1 Tax=Aeromicrobium sp. Leaf245 TaxID=1736306 RepID=UPI000AE9C987|nr:hypothetical protein [Aeromicrobium sp. Leaf245]